MTTAVHPEGKSARSLREAAFRLAALALTAAPLVIALSALSGIGHRWIDILAQFTAPTVIATLLLAAGFLIVRRWRWALAATGVLALLLAAAWPQWFPHPGKAATGAPIVRLYSANLYYLNNDVAEIRRSIAEADADILVLIELGRTPAAQIDALLADYPYRVASMRMDETRGPSRSLVASRWPLRGVANRPDGLHSVTAVAETPLGRVNVVGVHLTRPWPFQPQWGQISQTMALADIRRTLDGPVIVAGDFNSASSARIGRQVKQDMELLPAGGFPGTWPASAPAPLAMTIDQVWRSPDLAFVSRRLGRPTGSDHRPVVTEFTRAAD
jgi:endonuclease/exonuclease/phosphatase (EEP) superfamily protein YafD